MTSMQQESPFEVVHDKVVIRAEPSTKGAMLSVVLKGTRVRGVPVIADGINAWLRIGKASIEELLPRSKCDAAWLLIDGKSVGLGQLLRPLSQDVPGGRAGYPKANAPKAQAGKAKAQAAKAKPNAKAEAKAETFKEESVLPPVPENARQTGPRTDFIVVHEKAVVRHIPSTKGALVDVLNQGSSVAGVPFDVDGEPWVQVKKGWMLVDGKSKGLGQLLATIVDVAEDVVEWARQQKLTEAGRDVLWTAETETELLQLESAAREQVRPLQAIDSAAAWQELVQKGFITADDLTLGSDGIAQAVLRKLLRRRAGVLILAESPPDDILPWSETSFEKFMKEQIQPLSPFSCKLMVPKEVPTQRLLVLLHGSFVRGDDLVGEAEVLQNLMPETAIALPEAPILVDETSKLRTWWPLPAEVQNEANASSNSEIFKAPDLAIKRFLSTIKRLHARFGAVPLLVGGFSQGAMLVSQALVDLARLEVAPVAAVLLSGMAAPFCVPTNMRCLALHGDQDERLPLDLAREVLAKHEEMQTAVTFEVLPGLGHEISDAVLDRIATFCDEVAAIDSKASFVLSRQEAASTLQEANQKKLLRWVKRISNAITMFDEPRFMQAILHPDMVGFGSGSRSVGGGLVKFELHDAGKESQGTVVIFHGKIRNLREGTRNLVAAYKRLKLSVCVIDYRQKFSQFGVDATVVLDEMEVLTGSKSLPVIIHGIGCAGIHALHVAIASHSYPRSLQRRLCHLVLDGSVCNFKSLPPMPTGCIAVDPIGNDQKLKYVGMPLCILGGDDECCGHVEQVSGARAQGNYVNLSKTAEVLLQDGQLHTLTLDAGLALMDVAGDARLTPALYRSTRQALDLCLAGSCSAAADKGEGPDAMQRFFDDVLASEEDANGPETLAKGFEEEELHSLCEKIVQAAAKPKARQELWKLRRLAKKDDHLQMVIRTHEPLLAEQGKFAKGSEGFKQFETVMAVKSVKSRRLAEMRIQLHKAFDIKALDVEVARLERDRKLTSGITLEQCHIMAEESKIEWESKAMWNRLLTLYQQKPAQDARSLIKEVSSEMSARHWMKMGLQGTYEEMEVQLNTAIGHFRQLDPSLWPKLSAIQGSAMRVAAELAEHIKSTQGAAEAKVPAQINKVKDSAPVKEIEVVVYIARDLGLMKRLVLPQGSPVHLVKEKLARDDPTGATKSCSFGLLLNGNRLDEDAKIEKTGLELDIEVMGG
eukprot:TRINITY_DN6483_c0_g1_i1.p1 TRINITY_DN6483_c0_g1~~TRINITY_DN6483_c0_g1_i1.p1  ORF type:complete len:1239 (+),score=321.36 TRINITY_DN6483_c0_g1_i1:74-3718(+)